MNSRCKNKNCFYYKTCIMDNTNNKCSGKLSIKNPNHPNSKLLQGVTMRERNR